MFTQGQIVKRVSNSSEATPLRVTAVWKNGVFKVEYVDGTPISSTYAFRGERAYARGDSYSRSHIEPLAPGETAGSIFAANEDARQAKKNEQALKRAAELTAINEWWEQEGNKFWSAREIIDGFDGSSQEVSVIRYSQYGESRIALVTVRHEKNWEGQTEIELVISGLTIKNSYCSSTCREPTLEEAVYQAFAKR